MMCLNWEVKLTRRLQRTYWPRIDVETFLGRCAWCARNPATEKRRIENTQSRDGTAHEENKDGTSHEEACWLLMGWPIGNSSAIAGKRHRRSGAKAIRCQPLSPRDHITAGLNAQVRPALANEFTALYDRDILHTLDGTSHWPCNSLLYNKTLHFNILKHNIHMHDNIKWYKMKETMYYYGILLSNDI